MKQPWYMKTVKTEISDKSLNLTIKLHPLWVAYRVAVEIAKTILRLK